LSLNGLNANYTNSYPAYEHQCNHGSFFHAICSPIMR
jgi:hypothetical protein